jgi:hypothetical protein
MVHLVLLGVLGLAAVIWAIKNRAWELEVTVEMSAAKAPDQAARRRRVRLYTAPGTNAAGPEGTT